MIDLSTERPITLAQLARSLPARRKGRPINPSTIYRWCTAGVAGQRLEHVRIGGAMHTSLAAFQRWCEAVTAAKSGAAVQTTVAGERAHRQAMKRLEQAGV